LKLEVQNGDFGFGFGGARRAGDAHEAAGYDIIAE